MGKIRDKTIAKVESIQDIDHANLTYLNDDNEPRKDAYIEAHKLAGSLGNFGYSRGSEIARTIESLLGGEEPITTEKQIQIKQLTQDLLKELKKPPNQPKINLIKDVTKDSLLSLLIVDNDTILGEKIIREAHSRFWQILESSNPDLLIIDVEIPHDNGIDLCQVIRNEPRWRYLPILILKNHTDPETRAELFGAGADDFISKPVVGPELIARLFSRLHRSRLCRSIAEIDTLTGVENRYKSTEDINRLIRLASRHKQPLCFAILDIDNFKDINDQYGHDTGDWVLHQFGEVIKKAFRQEDIVGRWGGEEFAVTMYGTYKQDAINRLQKVLEEWRLEVLVPEDNIAFSVTFSGGVAEYPEDGEDLQLLYRAADATLYEAKKAGRNQIMG